MTKSYTSPISRPQITGSNLKQNAYSYRHRGKYGRKSKMIRSKIYRRSFSSKFEDIFQDVLYAMSLLNSMPPVEYVDKRPINENIYKVD